MNCIYLICKLDAKLEGIPHATGIWLYSVSAMFHLGFENSRKSFLRLLFIQFTDKWLSSYDQPELPKMLLLSYCKKSNSATVCGQSLLKTLATDTGNDKSGQDRNFQQDVQQEMSCGTFNSKSNASVSKNDGRCEQTLLINSAENFKKFKAIVFDILVNTNASGYKDEFERGTVENVCTNLFNLIQHKGDGMFHILQLIQAWLQFERIHSDVSLFRNNFNIAESKYCFLRFLCEWLGWELNSNRKIILEKCDSFKQKHISCIDNLPPAKCIVQEIFPEFMVKLFLCWMDKSAATDGMNILDTSQPLKATKLDQQDTVLNNESSDKLYPFIQLLLEFANGSLISGVAHVVYPRLLYSS